MGSPFASLTVSEPIPLPFDEGQTIRVRALSGQELEAAQTAHMKSLVAGRSARGWSGAFQRIIAGIGTPADAEQALADPLAGYDRTVIVRGGLFEWSYPQSLTPVTVKHDGKPDQIVDAIADLKDEPLEFIARTILKLTKPTLFQTQEEAKAAQREADAVPSFAGR
jgi:hypothetical protein